MHRFLNGWYRKNGNIVPCAPSGFGLLILDYVVHGCWAADKWTLTVLSVGYCSMIRLMVEETSTWLTFSILKFLAGLLSQNPPLWLMSSSVILWERKAEKSGRVIYHVIPERGLFCFENERQLSITKLMLPLGTHNLNLSAIVFSIYIMLYWH